MRSLRGRLFAATLAALAITLGLTLAIGGILTRRQVDRTQAATIARLADDRAHDRRQHVSYRNGIQKLGSIIVMVQLRATFATLVPNVNRPSNGETRFAGKQQIYSYRLISNFGPKGSYRDDFAAAKSPITIIAHGMFFSPKSRMSV